MRYSLLIIAALAAAISHFRRRAREDRTTYSMATTRDNDYDFFRGYSKEQRSRMTQDDMMDALYRPHEAQGIQRGRIRLCHIGQLYDWHPELICTQEMEAVEEVYRSAWKNGSRPFWWKEAIDSGDRSIPWRASVIGWKNGIEQVSASKGDTILNESTANEAYMEVKLAKRLPALGLEEWQLDELEHEANDDSTSELEKVAMFLFIRNTMLGQLISCDGASTLKDLIRILRIQLATGKPAPIPTWFHCSDGPFLGTGYHVCENRGCHRTDTLKKQLSKCSKCKIAVYCSKECLKADRKARHKVCCREARELNALYESRHKR